MALESARAGEGFVGEPGLGKSGLIEEFHARLAKAGDQALRRSAFQQAIAHLSKAIEMADKGPGALRRRPSPSRVAGKSCRPTTLVLWSKGFAADETRAAFERTGDLATRANFPLRGFPRSSANFFGMCCTATSARHDKLRNAFGKKRNRRGA